MEEKEEDIQRIKKLQLELHSDFINLVKKSRGSKLKDAEKQTEDLSNKIDEIIVNAKKQSESISKNIIDKTTLTIQSKEKNSIDRIKQIELSAVQSIKNQASIELNKLIFNYFSEISDDNKARMLNKSVADLKSIN